MWVKIRATPRGKGGSCSLMLHVTSSGSPSQEHCNEPYGELRTVGFSPSYTRWVEARLTLHENASDLSRHSAFVRYTRRSWGVWGIWGHLTYLRTSVYVSARAHRSATSDSHQGSALVEVGCCGLAEWRKVPGVRTRSSCRLRLHLTLARPSGQTTRPRRE